MPSRGPQSLQRLLKFQPHFRNFSQSQDLELGGCAKTLRRPQGWWALRGSPARPSLDLELGGGMPRPQGGLKDVTRQRNRMCGRL